MLAVQLSDLHILRSPAGAMFADNASRLRRTIEFVKKINPLPDVALVSGDISHEGDLVDYNYCRAILSELPCPYFVIPGNHDHRHLVRKTFPLDKVRADDEFYQFECDSYSVRLIGIDTVENGKVGGELCPRRLDWIEKTLARSDKPALMIMHHPPYSLSAVANPEMSCNRGTEQLAKLIRNRGNVMAILCGHLHRETSAAWADTRALTVSSIAPSFSLDINNGLLTGWHHSSPGIALHLLRAGNEVITHMLRVDDHETTVPLS